MLWVFASFAGLTLATYSGVLDAPFVFDDAKFLNEPLVQARSLGDLPRLFAAHGQPRKVGLASFALNHLVSGGFHRRPVRSVSLALHIANAALLFAFLRALVQSSAFGPRLSDAALLAGVAVWLVHPVQTQAISYAWQRFTPLVSFFFLLSLWAALQARDSSGWRRPAWCAAATVVGLLALGTKENAGMLPAAALLLLALFPRLGAARFFANARRAAALILVAVALLGIVSAYYLGPNAWAMIERDSLHRGFTPWRRVMTEWRVVVHYVSLLLWPAPSRLTLDYDWPISTGLLAPPTTLLSLALIAGGVMAALAQVRKRPLFAFALSWFLGNLVIESSFIPLDLVFEHRLYLPSMLPLALGGAWLMEKVAPGVPRIALAVALVVWLGAWARQRNQVWTDEVVLWEDAAQKSPAKARVHWNLGKAYFMRGDYERARPPTQRALELDPGLTGALNNMATIEMARGRLEDARAYLKRALEQAPTHLSALINLGVVELRLGQTSQAIAPLEKALEVDPTNETAIASLVAAHYNLAEYARAEARARQGCDVHPRSARLWAFLGAALERQGRRDDARQAVAHALQLDPQQAVARDALARLR